MSPSMCESRLEVFCYIYSGVEVQVYYTNGASLRFAAAAAILDCSLCRSCLISCLIGSTTMISNAAYNASTFRLDGLYPIQFPDCSIFFRSSCKYLSHLSCVSVTKLYWNSSIFGWRQSTTFNLKCEIKNSGAFTSCPSSFQSGSLMYFYSNRYSNPIQNCLMYVLSVNISPF